MNFFIYFRLVRWKNLVLITYVFYLIAYLLYPFYNIQSLLSDFQFFSLFIAVISITAAGYIINDIYDIKTDEINKPQKVIVSKVISIEKAKRWYLFTNGIGLIIGIGLCLKIEKPSLSLLFIGTTLLLYYYSKIYKKKPLIGNVIISFLVAFSILIVPVFTLNNHFSNKSFKVVISIIILLSIFAFFLNLVREIVKDIEDVNGDYTLKMNTLPILIGRSRSKTIASYICYIPVLLIFYIVYFYSDIYKYTALYLVVFTLVPLLYIATRIRVSKSKKQFQKISIYLKITMFFGISSILIFTLFN